MLCLNWLANMVCDVLYVHHMSSLSLTNRQAPPSNGKGPHLVTSQQVQTTQSSSTTATAPPNYFQATPQLRQQILRSKVTEATQRGDEVTIAKITEDLLKLSVQQQAYLLSDPKLFTAKVRETEQVLGRYVET